MDIEFHSADIRNVFRALSDAGRVNIVVHSEVRGQVTVRLKDVTWRQAFDAIVRSNGLLAEEEGSVLMVYPIERYREIKEGARSR